VKESIHIATSIVVFGVKTRR